ncbi:MAG TPA: glycosyltransferase family 2 protein [Candidatus Elarobacter sp.]|nr:glycosyltransferase family 2 protein [Candidatus Elarobacter sp.]
MKLSVVATLYRSAGTVEEFVRRALAAAEPLFAEIEVVLVNDGSPDDSLEKALALHARDPRIVVVDLSRNFGHHRAIMTGLAHATGDLVFLLDSDLEEAPEYLSAFYERFRQGDCDVVYGVQIRRKGGAFERISGHAFFWLANALSDRPLPPNTVTARLMSARYVRALVAHQDREFTLGHLFVTAGFAQVPLPVTKLSISPTTYTLARRFDMAIRYITTNSSKLLYVILCVGAAVSVLSVGAIAFAVWTFFHASVQVSGWTSLIASIWLFGGLTTLILGILGTYIANIHTETKHSPYTIVRRVHRRE